MFTMNKLPKTLLFIWLGIVSLAFVIEQTVNLRDLVGMDVSGLFWEAVLSGLFLVTLIGILIVQDRQIEGLRQEIPHRPADVVGEALRRGSDIVAGLSQITGGRATYELQVAIEDWASRAYYLLHPSHPGVAAFFLSDIPQNDHRYEKELLLDYMYRRLGDLRKVTGQT